MYKDIVEYETGKTATDTVYSDRLYMGDSKKYDRLCKKHFGNKGQHFSNRLPRRIQSFLREYLKNKDLVITRIEQIENRSTGYPVWRFDYR